MRKSVLLLTIITIIVIMSIPCFAIHELTLDDVENIHNGDSIMAGVPVTFTIRLTHTTGSAITGSCNGWKFWTHRNGIPNDHYDRPDGRDLGTVTTIMPGAMYDGGVFCGNVYGSYEEGGLVTKWCGFKMFGTGIPVGFDLPIYAITVLAFVAGDTLCVDSSYFPPGGVWLWSSSPDIIPDWDGPHCYHVIPRCCEGDRGNVNMTGTTDISDLTTLVEYIFPPHNDLPCLGAGNVDGRCGSGVPVDVSDLTYLVDYLFGGGPAPPPCE